MLALAAVLSGGCAPRVTVSTDYDPAANFTTLRTYAWAERRPQEDVDPRVTSGLLDRRIQNAVDGVLRAKGYQLVTGAAPDFRVAYHVVLEQRLETRAYPAAYGYGSGWWGRPAAADVRVVQYDRGTLLLDVVDARTNEMIWRGSGSAPVDFALSPDERTRRVDDAVVRILDRFPPPLR